MSTAQRDLWRLPVSGPTLPNLRRLQAARLACGDRDNPRHLRTPGPLPAWVMQDRRGDVSPRDGCKAADDPGSDAVTDLFPVERAIGHCWLCAGERLCDTPEICGGAR